MKKFNYIAPTIEVADFVNESDMLAGSPTGTNIEGLGIADEEAEQGMEGRSRFSVWEDEE
jgi:hypothetical protein